MQNSGVPARRDGGGASLGDARLKAFLVSFRRAEGGVAGQVVYASDEDGALALFRAALPDSTALDAEWLHLPVPPGELEGRVSEYAVETWPDRSAGGNVSPG